MHSVVIDALQISFVPSRSGACLSPNGRGVSWTSPWINDEQTARFGCGVEHVAWAASSRAGDGLRWADYEGCRELGAVLLLNAPEQPLVL
jgi:hypothetical protein